MQVEVFADVWCPFAHVELTRFVSHRAERGGGPTLIVRAWPLELVDDEPQDPVAVAEEIEAIRAGVAPELFTGFDRRRFPETTLPALELTAAAYRRGAEVGEAVALELRHRLFERGEDVSDPEVLRAVAAVHDLAVELDDHGVAARADWKEGQKRGVVGSPHFFTPGGDFFAPTIEVQETAGHVEVRDDPEGAARFRASCHPTG